jgi:hypothetical protein
MGLYRGTGRTGGGVVDPTIVEKDGKEEVLKKTGRPPTGDRGISRVQLAGRRSLFFPGDRSCREGTDRTPSLHTKFSTG